MPIGIVYANHVHPLLISIRSILANGPERSLRPRCAGVAVAGEDPERCRKTTERAFSEEVE